MLIADLAQKLKELMKAVGIDTDNFKLAMPYLRGLALVGATLGIDNCSTARYG